MSASNNLEIRGNFYEHPLAELLVEAAEARLNGSFRLVNQAQKTIIYLREGAVVFAVSNARQHRLFEILLQSERLTRAQVAEIPDFASDQSLGEAVVAGGLIARPELDNIFLAQIETIVKSVLEWTEGEWIFSPLVRIKDTAGYKIETGKLLREYARSLSPDKIVRRFRSFQESFGVKQTDFSSPNLLPEEAFLLSRFDESLMKIQDVVALGGMPEAATIRTLYVLWLGGYLFRQNWNSAFSARKINNILSAKLSIKRDENAPSEMPANEPQLQKIKEEIVRAPVKTDAPKLPETKTIKPPEPIDERRRMEDYLTRIEESDTLYEVLGVAPNTKITEIKSAYFSLAKRFHPDLFHKESGSETHRRIQTAFTEIAHAYEVLKDENSREIYDYKNREKIAASQSANKTRTKKAVAGGAPVSQTELARESFEQGYTYLMDEEYEEALPLLARAVQLAPDNARYHAFYGKLLSADEKSTHKAESEMQLAVKLEPNNVTFRIMLAEFFIDIGLHRRAEGELQRLLALAPKNPEALNLLDSLSKK